MNRKENAQTRLQLIPKSEKYIEYMLQIMIKLPRTEKFSIGNEYKNSLYKMLRNIMHLNKVTVENDKKYSEFLNEIDAELNTQRIYLRIMKTNRWIDERKFKIAIEQIYELGKILGGLIKYYAKNNKK